MIQENKDLLIKDLCARLPYNVYVRRYVYTTLDDAIESVELFNVEWLEELYAEEAEFKPYLFPLSNISEKQKEELFKLCEFCIQEDWEGKKCEVYAIEIASRFDPAYCYDHNFNLWNIDMRAIDWLLKNHFDINNLIPKGLAIDATNLNIY